MARFKLMLLQVVCVVRWSKRLAEDWVKLANIDVPVTVLITLARRTTYTIGSYDTLFVCERVYIRIIVGKITSKQQRAFK